MSQIDSLRLSLKSAVSRLDVNRSGSLATQEVSKSDLSAQEKKVLAQAISRAANSEGGQSVANVQKWVDRFVDDFQARDTDGNGALSEAEIAAAPKDQNPLKAMQALVVGGFPKATP